MKQQQQQKNHYKLYIARYTGVTQVKEKWKEKM